MNIEDVVDVEYGLQQDEWSLTKPVFGEDGQLQVVGWSGRDTSGKNKFYIIKCNSCCADKDLFGDGIFKTTKSNLNKNYFPCGCSKRSNWTHDQWKIRAQRKATELGYEFVGFVGFVGEWSRSRTKIRLSCPQHGTWSSGTLRHLISSGAGCPECKRQTLRDVNLKSDEDMIDSFFSTGAFHPDTKFWRSDRKNSIGRAVFWNIYCPECGGNGESTCNNLQRGTRPCLCSNARQHQAYINLAKANGEPIAVKFGIANNAIQRVKEQNYASVYTIENHIVYEFPTKQECLAAELECKRELPCGVVSKEEMEDGWTETTYLSNLNKIIEIYKKHNGVIYES